MNIAVYCGSSFGKNPAYAKLAHDLGVWIAGQGHTLVYGGSNCGLMGEVSSTVRDNGGRVIGVETTFFHEAGLAQSGLSELILVDSISKRKAKMIELADAFVALPGGVGTLEEISEIMSLIRLGMTEAPCIMVDADGFYRGLGALLDAMLEDNFINQDNRRRFVFAKDANEVIATLEAFASAV